MHELFIYLSPDPFGGIMEVKAQNNRLYLISNRFSITRSSSPWLLEGFPWTGGVAVTVPLKLEATPRTKWC